MRAACAALGTMRYVDDDSECVPHCPHAPVGRKGGGSQLDNVMADLGEASMAAARKARDTASGAGAFARKVGSSLHEHHDLGHEAQHAAAAIQKIYRGNKARAASMAEATKHVGVKELKRVRPPLRADRPPLTPQPTPSILRRGDRWARLWPKRRTRR